MEGLFGGGGADGQSEDGAQARPDRVGVVEVGSAVGHNQCRDPGGVAASQHGPHVPRLLHALDHGHERIVGQCHVRQGRAGHRRHADDAFGPITEGQLLEHRLGDVEDLGTAVGQLGQHALGVVATQ